MLWSGHMSDFEGKGKGNNHQERETHGELAKSCSKENTLWNCGKVKKPVLKLHKSMDSVGGGMFNKGRKVFLWLSSGVA